MYGEALDYLQSIIGINWHGAGVSPFVDLYFAILASLHLGNFVNKS